MFGFGCHCHFFKRICDCDVNHHLDDGFRLRNGPAGFGRMGMGVGFIAGQWGGGLAGDGNFIGFRGMLR